MTREILVSTQNSRGVLACACVRAWCRIFRFNSDGRTGGWRCDERLSVIRVRGNNLNRSPLSLSPHHLHPLLVARVITPQGQINHFSWKIGFWLKVSYFFSWEVRKPTASVQQPSSFSITHPKVQPWHHPRHPKPFSKLSNHQRCNEVVKWSVRKYLVIFRSWIWTEDTKPQRRPSPDPTLPDTTQNPSTATPER